KNRESRPPTFQRLARGRYGFDLPRSAGCELNHGLSHVQPVIGHRWTRHHHAANHLKRVRGLRIARRRDLNPRRMDAFPNGMQRVPRMRASTRGAELTLTSPVRKPHRTQKLCQTQKRGKRGFSPTLSAAKRCAVKHESTAVVYSVEPQHKPDLLWRKPPLCPRTLPIRLHNVARGPQQNPPAQRTIRKIMRQVAGLPSRRAHQRSQSSTRVRER